MLAIADTHALIWYLLDDRRLSSAARSVFADAVTRGEPIGIPSICLVEIIYLTENRTTVPDMPDRIITATALQLGLPLLSRDEKIRASGIATIW